MVAFLSRSAKKCSPPSWPKKKKKFTSNGVTSFLDWTHIVKATKKFEDLVAMIKYKSLCFYLYRPNGLTTPFLTYIIKYLPLPNQLHFWTGHIHSIVNVFEDRVTTAKKDGSLFFPTYLAERFD